MPRNPASVSKGTHLDIFAMLASALLHPLSEYTAGPRNDQRASAIAGAPRKRGVFARLEQWLTTLRQREVEAYLSKATDLCDLEARIRSLERRSSYP